MEGGIKGWVKSTNGLVRILIALILVQTVGIVFWETDGIGLWKVWTETELEYQWRVKEHNKEGDLIDSLLDRAMFGDAYIPAPRWRRSDPLPENSTSEYERI